GSPVPGFSVQGSTFIVQPFRILFVGRPFQGRQASLKGSPSISNVVCPSPESDSDRFGVTIMRLQRSPSLHTEAAGASPPDAFGPFRVLHQIGAGTLGPVFRAYDSRREHLLAVKLSKLALPPERVHRLVAELDRIISAGLTHPALAAPLETGIHDVCAYLVPDYVAAESLDLAVRECGPAPAADALRVAARIGGAPDVAAAATIAHASRHPRDLLASSDVPPLTGIGVPR